MDGTLETGRGEGAGLPKCLRDRLDLIAEIPDPVQREEGIHAATRSELARSNIVTDADFKIRTLEAQYKYHDDCLRRFVEENRRQPLMEWVENLGGQRQRGVDWFSLILGGVLAIACMSVVYSTGTWLIQAGIYTDFGPDDWFRVMLLTCPMVLVIIGTVVPLTDNHNSHADVRAAKSRWVRRLGLGLVLYGGGLVAGLIATSDYNVVLRKLLPADVGPNLLGLLALIGVCVGGILIEVAGAVLVHVCLHEYGRRRRGDRREPAQSIQSTDTAIRAIFEEMQSVAAQLDTMKNALAIEADLLHACRGFVEHRRAAIENARAADEAAEAAAIARTRAEFAAARINRESSITKVMA